MYMSMDFWLVCLKKKEIHNSSKLLKSYTLNSKISTLKLNIKELRPRSKNIRCVQNIVSS